MRFGVGYMAPPFFISDVDKMGHIAIEDLDISESLRGRVIKWDAVFQNTFVNDNPQDSGFFSVQDLNKHNNEGAEIAELLRLELGNEFGIEFLPLNLDYVIPLE